MSYELLKRLEPQLSGQRVSKQHRSVAGIARVMPLSPTYQRWLLNTDGAITFGKGAVFKTAESSPLNDKRGYQSLDILYGPGDAENSVLAELARYQDELPENFVPIGQTPGGNLVCVNAHGVVYLWDHEAVSEKPYWRICDDIDSFLNGLEPDHEPPGEDGGIVESESWLDF